MSVIRERQDYWNYEKIIISMKSKADLLVNKTKPETQELRYLDFVVYELIKPDIEPYMQLTVMDDVKGCNIVAFEMTKTLTNNILSSKLTEWREKYIYDIDGVIVTHNKHRKTTENNTIPETHRKT